MTSLDIFQQFAAAINHHDVDALVALMHPDHAFVDSMGNRTQGAGPMQAAWRAYFAICSDYWIRVDTPVADGETVLATGEAGGVIDSVPWRTPAAWKAVVDGGLMMEWRVFADNKPVYDILAKRK